MPFTPPASCIGWYVASEETEYAGGESVTTATDQSPAGNDATQSSGSAPTYAPSVAEINGLAAYQFAGPGDAQWLRFPSAVLTDCTIIFVLSVTGDCGLLGNAASGGTQIRYGQSGANVLSTYDGGNNPESSELGAEQGVWCICEYNASSGTVTFYQASGGGNPAAYGTGAFSGGTFNTIGDLQGPNNTLPTTGYIAELAIFDESLGSADRAAYYSYLNAAYFAAPPTGPALSLTPTSATVSDGAPLSLLAALVNSTATLAASLTGGGTISTTSPVSGTAFTWTPPASGTGTAIVTVTDSADSFTEECTINYAPTPLSASVLASSTITASAVAFTFAGVSGGAGSYSTQLRRSTTSGFAAPDGTAVGAAVDGASGTLVDSSPLAAGTVAYYVAETTDAAGSTTTSGQLPGSAKFPPLAILFIGDSRTQGAGAVVGVNDMPTLVASELQIAFGDRDVACINQGVGGTTTTAWMPGTPNDLAAATAAEAAGTVYVHVDLGTNDCSTSGDIDQAQYQTNMTAITSAWVARGLKVILPFPYYVDVANGTYVGVWVAESLNVLFSYQSVIAWLWDGVNVLPGDTLAWSYMANHRNLMPDGVHGGYAYVAQMRARAIAAAIQLGA